MMYQMIVDAMQELAEAGSIFGSVNRQKGEIEFQLALGRKLEELTGLDGWSWRYGSTEERFKTAALKNKEGIEIDLVGRHRTKGTVAIELKYVMAAADLGAPSDRAAFPWDIAKDCLKLDLLRGGHCTPADTSVTLPDPNNLKTCVIAMTDWPNYWRGERPLAWATNFVKAMRKTPVRFEGLFETTGGNPENTIFKQGRCHIAFGLCWTGEWRPYRLTKQAERFRFLLLRPEPDAKPQWTHHQTLSVKEQSAIYPFLNNDSREEWRRRKVSPFDNNSSGPVAL
ncbi:hypothetical protein [Bradyrhizobium sp. AZCC 2289]|uniref:hypothetical protein n=1 Tax=Bradyrhizobium sp. AZCC 2289 TaxID=3117026 RepID=UPI002FEF83F5